LDLKKLFEDLKKSKWIWAIYIPLTIPLVLLLMLVPYCLAPILAAIVTFGIPYLLGVRSVKIFLKAGIVIIIVTGILLGVLVTYFMYEQIYYFEEKKISDTELVEGIVTPYLGSKSTSFNYTVKYIGEESPENITVYVNITDVYDELIKSVPLKNADGLYYNETTLDENVNYYYFSAYLHNSGEWIETDEETRGFGPITIPFSDMLGSQIMQGVLILFFNVGLMFFFILVLFWWAKKARQDREKLYRAPEAEKEEEEEEEEMEEGGEEEEFEEEGKEGGEDVTIDEEESSKEGKVEAKGEYTCTSCGADVDADATSCPNCGEEFEGEEEEKEGN
jgi:hypothetical protein